VWGEHFDHSKVSELLFFLKKRLGLFILGTGRVMYNFNNYIDICCNCIIKKIFKTGTRCCCCFDVCVDVEAEAEQCGEEIAGKMEPPRTRRGMEGGQF
jgi:hypothetical protein